ncbi:uncharacterized protein [Apostichopus japonicus]|uniref:uncharacterized protein n=1 Tax=Stichopus japonicus TaxID=307972 RepID=UPI003AB61E77
MRVKYCAVVFVFTHLCLLTIGDVGDEGTDEYVNPYGDMYDSVTQKEESNTDGTKTENKQDCTSELKADCKHCGFSLKNDDGDDDDGDLQGVTEESQFDQSSCPSSDHLILHFARSLLKTMESSESNQVVIKLSNRQKEKLKEYINDYNQPAGNIKDMLAASMDPYYNEAVSDFNRSYGAPTNKFLIGLLMMTVSVCVFIMLLNCQFSFWRVTLAVLMTAFFTSCFFSYMYLHAKESARRMNDDAKRQAFSDACFPLQNGTFLTNIGQFFRGLVTKDDPCLKEFEDHQIDIIYAVLPIDAVTHTIGSVFKGLSLASGSSLSGFISNFYDGLPVLMWIPASLVLLLAVVLIIAVCLYCQPRKVIIREIQEQPQIRRNVPPPRVQDISHHNSAVTDGDAVTRNDSTSDPAGSVQRVENVIVPKIASDESSQDIVEKQTDMKDRTEQQQDIKDRTEKSLISSHEGDEDDDDFEVISEDEQK